MQKVGHLSLELRPHSCPLCEAAVPHDLELFPARLDTKAASAAVFSARRQPDKLHYRLVQCLNDGLVRSDPVLPTDQLHQLYRDSHFTYDQEVSLLTQTYLTALQPVLKNVPKTAQLLEIGCGNGFILSKLARLGFSNLHGVEPSREAVAKAPVSIKKKIIQKPFSAQLLPAHSLDGIFVFQTLDHIADLNQFLEDCYTLLKPGGFFLSYHHNVAFWLVKILGELHPIIDVEHTQLFDQKTTKAMLTKHGFEIESLRSPINYVSLRHTLHLLPIPAKIKTFLEHAHASWWQKILQFPLSLEFGNICVIARKPAVREINQSSALTSRQKQLRRQIVQWSYTQKLSHLGSCLSAVDLLAAIYDIKHDQDQVILSSGHAALAWYAVLVEQKILSKTNAIQLSVHPDRNLKHGIGVSTGSLGQGLPIAIGQALASPDKTIFCVTSDGEWSEGSMTEALRIAVSEKAHNLTIIINANGWAAYRPTAVARLRQELTSHGVEVQTVDGHNLEQLKLALKIRNGDGPQVILAQTTVEQIPCLTGQAAHYHVMSKQDYQAALKCLK